MSSIPYNRETRRKEVAIILAVFMGWMGAHKFYLGKWGAGVAYAVLAFSMIPLFLSAIDIIRLAMMDKTEFDWKYNTIPFMTPRKEDVSRREEKRKGDWKVERTRKYFDEGVKRARGKYVDNAEYKQGIKLFTDYLYRQALEQFELALKAFPNHPEILFQMACCNALLEQKEELFANLGKAVEYGLSNVERIRTTEALSYLRIQQEYDRIEISGFKDWRLMDYDEEELTSSDGQSSNVEEKVEEVKEPLSTDDLLVELKKLAKCDKKELSRRRNLPKKNINCLPDVLLNKNKNKGMLAIDIINIDIPPLSMNQSGEDAISVMEEYMVRHLPIVEDREVMGMVSEEMILDNDQDAMILSYRGSDSPVFVHSEDHILEILAFFAKTNLTCVAVVDAQIKYVGMITLQQLMMRFATEYSFDEPGAIIVLELNKVDYSLTEISRIIESEKGTILSCLISQQREDSNILLVTLKINLQDIQYVKATFERFNYNIVAAFSEVKYVDTLSERYEALMHYLNM